MHQTMRWGKLILVCIVMLLFAVWVIGSINSATRSLEEEKNALTIQANDLKNEQAELELQISQVGNEKYIEAKAREDYQFLKEGELRFEFVNPQALYEYTEEETRRRNELLKTW
ncbi:MAG: septum formation initiator family protein [Clostridia bacterium]|nr:septum formation initiator family protein [Clostridia bacterium]